MKRKKCIKQIVILHLLGILFFCPTAISARQITVNVKKLTLYAGESKNIKVRAVSPSNVSKAVVFKSIKPQVASISAQGRIKAKKEGKTEILVISKKDPGIKTSVKITVKKVPKKTEREYLVKGGIHKLSLSEHTVWQQTQKKLYRNGGKGYEIIWSKDDFESLARTLKKNGCPDSRKFLQWFNNTNFKKHSLIIMTCSLFQAYDESVAGFSTEFDTFGMLRGTVQIRYKKQDTVPGIFYPQILDNYIVIWKMPKKDAAMTDYFKYEAAERL